jgi:hypothetical protein
MADESDAKLKNQQLNEIGTEILSWFLAWTMKVART